VYNTSLNYSRRISGINSSKGISPIIATVLLLGITISVAALFPSWIIDLTDTVTQETSQQNQRILDGASLNLEIVSATYEGPSNNVKMIVDLPSEDNINSSFNAVAYCDGSFGGSGSFNDLEGIKTVNFSSSCTPDRVKVSLQKYPTNVDSSNLKIVGYSQWSLSNFEQMTEISSNIFYQPLTLERNQDTLAETGFDGQKINTTVDNGEIRLEN